LHLFENAHSIIVGLWPACTRRSDDVIGLFLDLLRSRRSCPRGKG
jgi:hypothetical protein